MNILESIIVSPFKLAEGLLGATGNFIEGTFDATVDLLHLDVVGAAQGVISTSVHLVTDTFIAGGETIAMVVNTL